MRHTNPRNSSLSNKTPLHPQKNITVYVYNPANQLIASSSSTVNYDMTNGNFTGIADLGNNLPSGQYTIKVQSPIYLRRLITGIQTITALQSNNLPSAELVTGNINGDNALNILDYNLLIGCYSDLAAAVACDNTIKVFADINDDGHVNQVDYNLFLREIAVQSGY